MISQAKKNQTTASDPNLKNTIRILAQTWQSKRIQLIVTDYITPGAGGEWEPTRGELRLRPSTVTMGIPGLANALAHGSAHVAQSCRAGGIGKKALLLESKSNQPVSISVNLTYRSIEDRFLIGLLNLRPLLLEPFRHGRCHY